MGLRIKTNIASLNSQRQLGKNSWRLSKSMERLSSGLSINSAADNAAGLAISEKLRAEIRSLGQAKRNADDGISMIQTAEGGMNEVSNILVRLRELGVQSASDTVGNSERKFIDLEFQQLKSEIQRIAESTNFNGISLLDGFSGQLDIQIGSRNDPFRDRIVYDGTNSNASLLNLGILEDTVGTSDQALMTLDKIDRAIDTVNAIRADMGGIQNRLQSTINTLNTNTENLSAANSRIRDVDVAVESAELVKAGILQQASMAVLAQANSNPSGALTLIRAM